MLKSIVWLLLGLYGVPYVWRLALSWRDRGLNG
jgi:hypothetical protein